MKKKMAVKCDCGECKALAEKHGFELQNWFCDFERPTDFAIVPAKKQLDDEAKAHLFQVFSIPDYYEPFEYPLPEGNYEASFACKFADTQAKFQAAELVVRQYNGYYYCRLARYDKWHDGVLDEYQFIEWNAQRESELPPHLLWILCLSLDRAHLGVKHLFIQKMRWRSQGLRYAMEHRIRKWIPAALLKFLKP